MSATSKCIACLAPATIQHGHVLRGKRKVIAGWCSVHGSTESPRLLCTIGCYGGWHAKYGDTFKRRKAVRP